MTSGFCGRWVAAHRLQGPVVRGSVSACRCTHYTSVAGGAEKKKKGDCMGKVRHGERERPGAKST